MQLFSPEVTSAFVVTGSPALREPVALCAPQIPEAENLSGLIRKVFPKP